MVSHRESASGDRKDPKSKRQPTVRRDRIQAEPEGTEGPKKRKDCAGRGGPEVGGEGAPGPPDGQAALLRSPLRTTPLWVSGTRLFLLLSFIFCCSFLPHCLILLFPASQGPCCCSSVHVLLLPLSCLPSPVSQSPCEPWCPPAPLLIPSTFPP